jgi:hypothetical protein
MTMNDEYVRIWVLAVMFFVMVLFWHLSVNSEKNCEKPQT